MVEYSRTRQIAAIARASNISQRLRQASARVRKCFPSAGPGLRRSSIARASPSPVAPPPRADRSAWHFPPRCPRAPRTANDRRSWTHRDDVRARYMGQSRCSAILRVTSFHLPSWEKNTPPKTQALVATQPIENCLDRKFDEDHSEANSHGRIASGATIALNATVQRHPSSAVVISRSRSDGSQRPP